MATDERLEKLCAELQARIGILPKVNTDVFYLLNDDQSMPVQVIRAQPSSLSEIVRVVRAARSMKLHVRCCGASSGLDHNMYVDHHNVILQMTKLCDAERVRLERVRRADDFSELGIRVLAGVRIQELCDFELQNQVTVMTNDEMTLRTVVGAVVSGSKGIGRDSGSLADQVLQIRFVDCNGDLRTFTDDGTDANVKRLKRAVCSLGLVGVVYDVVLRAQPMQSVSVDYSFPTLGSLVADPSDLRRAVQDSFSTQIVYIPFNSVAMDAKDGSGWDPHADEVMVRTMTMQEAGETDQRSFIPLAEEVSPDLSFLEEPSRTPAAMKVTHEIHRRRFLCPKSQPLPWAIHSFGFHPKPVEALTWSFSTGDNFSTIPKLLEGVVEKLKAFAASGQYPLNVGVKINFTAATSVAMCPGKGDQPGTVANVSLAGVVGTPGWSDFQLQMAADWLEDKSSYPHWTTNWSRIPGIDEHLRQIYESDFSHLKELLEEIDRDGVFMNDRFRKLLYPSLQGYREKYINDHNSLFKEL